MLGKIFKTKKTIKKHLDAPLLKERLQYIQYLIDNGKNKKSMRIVSTCLLNIIHYLKLTKPRIVTFHEIDDAANRWANLNRKSFTRREKQFSLYAIKWLKTVNLLEKKLNSNTSFFRIIFRNTKSLYKHIQAPLLNERIKYLKYLYQRGSSESNLKLVSWCLLNFITYCNFNKLRKISSCEIINGSNQYKKYLKKIKSKNSFKDEFVRKSVIQFVSNSTKWLKFLGFLKKEKTFVHSFTKELNSYINYIKLEQGLSESTIRSRFFLLNDFLKNIYKKRKLLKNITPNDIDILIVEKQKICGYKRVTIKNYAGVIRKFIRYAEQKNWCKENISETIKGPRVYKNESLPYYPIWKNVKTILKNTKTRKKVDIRDHAIFMLLSVYGLRSSEIALLRLENLDWKNEKIYLQRAKKSKPQIFPLIKSVGDAILRYIKNSRPNNYGVKEVFVTVRSPYRRLTSPAIFAIVNRKLKPLNPKIKHFGPHAIRHACATHLINTGFSLKEIGDFLGHQALNTVRVYTKLDITSLKQVSNFKLGDLL